MGLFSKKKKKTNLEIYLEFLEELFGGEPHDINMSEAEDGGTPVSVLIWYDLPEKDYMTAVTYGLSEKDHPDWKYGKPELILTLRTKNRDWGIAMAIFANMFGSEKSFTYGTVLTTDVPLTKESDMCGFLVFAPAILEQEQAQVQLPDHKINLSGMYPIYKEEVPAVRRRILCFP